jgi:hypothetical protein
MHLEVKVHLIQCLWIEYIVVIIRRRGVGFRADRGIDIVFIVNPIITPIT